MYIKLNHDAMIIEQNKDSWINIEWIMDYEESWKVWGKSNSVEIYINKNCLQQIFMPAYYRGEIYYAETEEGFILSDDIFWIANQLRYVYIDLKMQVYFLKKGYLPQGMTLFHNIRRFVSNSTVKFNNGKLVNNELKYSDDSKFNNMDDNEIYSLFKETINNVVKSTITKDSGIFLSGGVDSRLLLAISKEYVENVTCISNCSSPYFWSNCSDVMTAERIAMLTNDKIIVDSIDYECLQIEELDPIIKKMPFSVHTGMNFKKMCLSASKAKVSNVLCGQNMDTLYNLGPTERMALDLHGISQWFKRFYLSEEYFKTLPDVTGEGRFVDKMIARIGEQMFAKVTHQPDLRLPSTAVELVENFIHNNDYTVFGLSSGYQGEVREKQFTPYEVKKELFQAKFSYLKGGDSQAVEVGGYLNGQKIYLPYSDYRMIEFFSQLRLRRKDVMAPKRFSYMYLKEFSRKYGTQFASFEKPGKKQMCERFGKVEDLYDAFEYIIFKTKWGEDIRKGAGIKASGYTGLMHYESLLRGYWYNRLIYLMSNEYGVEIKREE